MTGVLYLAWQHLRWHRWKVSILVTAVTLVLYLPLGLQLVVEQTAVLALMLSEVVMVLFAAALLAAILVLLTDWYGGALLRAAVM